MCNLLCESAQLREFCSCLKDRFAWGAGGAGAPAVRKYVKSGRKSRTIWGVFLNICKKIPPDHLFFGWEML
jgi:hypothetical protein